MTVATAWKKIDFDGRLKRVTLKKTYASGDTTVTCATGLRNLFGYTVSQGSSVATKYVTRGTVASGTVTLTVTDPLAACYLTLTAWGV
jgi:glycerol-3-phosphate dehydrogenase